VALQAPSYLTATLQRQSTAGQKRVIGAALCALGAACALVAAWIVAASGTAPPSGVAATIDSLPAVDPRRVSSRQRYDPLWWIPSLRVLAAFFSPLGAAAVLRLSERYARNSKLPTFGLQTEDEYGAASEVATQLSLRALAGELQKRGVPSTVSEHARRRLELLAAGGGQATGLLRSEALRWVRHAADIDNNTAADFTIGPDGRRVDGDEGVSSDGSDESDLAEANLPREPAGSPLRSWDYRAKPLLQGDETLDETASWSNIRLVKQVGQARASPSVRGGGMWVRIATSGWFERWAGEEG
jgi:hypothetical protein